VSLVVKHYYVSYGGGVEIEKAFEVLNSSNIKDVKVEVFEKRTIDDLVKLYGATRVAHKIFTEGLLSLAGIKIKKEKRLTI